MRDMAKWKKQSHVVYQCSYHIVWCPKYRFRILEGAVAKYVEERIRVICEWKDVEIEELNVMKDHVHLVVTVPPKVSISELMGFLKGKTAIGIVQNLQEPEAETILGKSFLEPRLLRNDHRAGRGEDTALRAIPGRQGAARRERARRTRPLLEAGAKATASGGGCFT